ncbi:MAG: alpha/beta fold hydrolase [Desulfopila sp.]
MTTFFLHGLDSSAQGTKGRYFSWNFPQVTCADFFGNLAERVDQLTELTSDQAELTLIGSSFGGLMATVFAIANPKRVKRLILLAPALNFAGFTPPQAMLDTPTLLVIGTGDLVTPPELVLPQARKTFVQLTEQLVEDDHMLHNTFQLLPWHDLIIAP